MTQPHGSSGSLVGIGATLFNRDAYLREALDSILDRHTPPSAWFWWTMDRATERKRSRASMRRAIPAFSTFATRSARA